MLPRSRLHKALVLLVLACASGPAWAYLDPGSGAVIVQALLAGVAGAFAVVRLYWGRLRAWLRKASGLGDDPGRDDP